MILDRAYGKLRNPSVVVPDGKTYYTNLLATKGYTHYDAFTLGLIWERRKESLNEYSLWYTFQRLGYDAINEYLVKEYGQNAVGGNGAPDWYYGKQFDAYRMNFPIPLTEMRTNPLMVQNDQYATN